MSEQEWLTSDNACKMLAWYKWLPQDSPWKRSARKSCLFGCGCARLVQDRFGDAEREMVEAAERLADDNFINLHDLYMKYYGKACKGDHVLTAAWCCIWSIRGSVSGEDRAMVHSHIARKDCEREDDHDPLSASLLRCIMGNLWRKYAWASSGAQVPGCGVTYLDPDWLHWTEGLIPSFARHVYDARAWGELPILADMLEDAGCQEVDILGHCRDRFLKCRWCDGTGKVMFVPARPSLDNPVKELCCANCAGQGKIMVQHGPHARGCHVVDLILGLS